MRRTGRPLRLCGPVAAWGLVAIAVAENLLFGTSNFVGFWFSNAAGGDGFSRGMAMEPLARIHPTEFFVSPGLWAGLALATVLLAATVRLRRYREPN